MGMGYELLSTPFAYAMPAYYDRHKPQLACKPIRVSFGKSHLESFIYWQPAKPTHESVIMWFHGGGYLVGDPQSMTNAADVYTSEGYRFISVGFRLMPWSPFPAQIEDAFKGVDAAARWLTSRTKKRRTIIVGGSSAGGMSAALVAYSRKLQSRFGLDTDGTAEAIGAYISCAAVLNADDMLLDFACPGPLGDKMLRTGIALDATRVKGPLNRDKLHEELMDYSPLALLEADDLPAIPYFGIHGLSDRMSPFQTETMFSSRLAERLGPAMSTLHVVEDPRWQHMVTTVTLHKRRVRDDPVLSHLFLWLGALKDETYPLSSTSR
jgi:acetyl esterase/lipase